MTLGRVVKVEVRGVPKPAGSKRVFMVGKGRKRRPVVTDDCAKGQDWRATVQHEITRQYAGEPLAGPVAVCFDFTMPRPAGHLGRRGLRPSAPAYPTVKPDVTKLIRAVEDAATGLLWRDDSQVTTQVGTKQYGARVGVVITCRPLEALEEGGSHASGNMGRQAGRVGAARDTGAEEPAQAPQARRV